MYRLADEKWNTICIYAKFMPNIVVAYFVIDASKK